MNANHQQYNSIELRSTRNPNFPSLKWYRFILKCVGVIVTLSFFLFHYSLKPAGVIDLDFQMRLRGPLSSSDLRLVPFIRSHFLEPPSMLPYNLSTDSIYNKFKHELSWPKIHAQLQLLFGETRGGYFVEAGALDGEFLSNTLWFEQTHGWTGLLVEPDPTNYQALRRKHRKAWLSNCCLSSHATMNLFESFKPNGKDLTYQWIVSGSSHLMDLMPRENPEEEMWFRSLSNPITRAVQCLPLASVLAALNVTSVDILSLDIQGAEEDILSTFPFGSVSVRVVVVEESNQLVNTHLIHIMNKAGFLLWDIVGEPDYIFVQRNDPLLKRGLKRPLQEYIDANAAKKLQFERGPPEIIREIK